MESTFFYRIWSIQLKMLGVHASKNLNDQIESILSTINSIQLIIHQNKQLCHHPLRLFPSHYSLPFLTIIVNFFTFIYAPPFIQYYLLELEKNSGMFDPDYEQLPYEEEQLTFQKVANVTAFTLRHTESYKSPTTLKANENFPQPYDNSLDKDIYANNAHLIKQATVDYLKNCLSAKFNTDQVFQQNQVFCFESIVERQGEEENCLESLICANRLLNETQKKDLLKNFEEFEELPGLIIELNQNMGKLITQEIVYVLASLFQAKMNAFLELVKKNDEGLLPKIGCFWGEENEEEFFKGSWEVYEDIDYEQVKKFASEGVEEHAMKLYFSGNLKYLSLREVKCEIKEGVSVVDKFATLIIHLSRNIFLNLSGIAQRPEEAEEISNELSLNLDEDGLSERPSKRIKTDE